MDKERLEAAEATARSGPFSSEYWNYTLFGALFGLLFPVAGTLIIMGLEELGFTLSAALAAQASNPLLWIIDSAPLWLGLFAGLAGRRQDRLRDLLTRQEALIAERTHQLSEALVQAKAASRAKSEFLAVMSHEMRTPLNGTIGMTELLMETRLDEDQRDMAQAALTSADGLLRLISGVLDYARMESDRLDLDEVEFSLETLVTGAADRVAEAAQARGLELLYEPKVESDRRFVGDGPRIRQLLQALLANAVKFTHAGDVTVRTWLGGQLDGRAEVVIEVEDTGIGMDAAALARIFDPFTQADSSSTRRYGGMGLGLAICRRLAARMGGGVTATSTPDVGSVFRLALPLQVGPTDPEAADPELALPPSGRVLLVDDHPKVRTLVGGFLDALGLRCSPAADAEEALRLLSEAGDDPFIAALIDLQMPEVDGLALARAIRQLPAAGGLPLVMMVSLEPEAAELGGLGFGAVLKKPLSPSVLARVLSKALAAQPEPEADTPEAATTSEPPPRTRVTHVLLAEDDLVNQKVAARMLRTMGCTVDVAQNGAEAVEAARTGTYHVILMDCLMPELDGYDATRQIRDLGPSFTELPIIALTANTSPQDRARCDEAGMSGFISKPLGIDALRKAIDSLAS